MNEDKLKKIVEVSSFEEDGRTKLACREAFRLAAEYEVELLDIARICNSNGIKICRCQLGCFK